MGAYFSPGTFILRACGAPDLINGTTAPYLSVQVAANCVDPCNQHQGDQDYPVIMKAGKNLSGLCVPSPSQSVPPLVASDNTVPWIRYHISQAPEPPGLVPVPICF